MKKNVQTQAVAVGAGLAALAAAAAGAYFLYGSKDAAKKRKQIKSWMLKMKAEVLEKLEKMKDLDEAAYMELVQTVSKKYEALKNVDPIEVATVTKELTGQWKALKSAMNPTPKKKVAKKAAKKVASK
jgi:hypothetical protein